jgi:hypothetical protein
MTTDGIIRITVIKSLKTVKFALEKVTKAQRGSRGIALIFL